MQDHKNQSEDFNTDSSSTGGNNNMANSGRGPQGIDKAPGEETAQGTENVKSETQTGKKVDRDFTKDSEDPIKQ